MRIKIIFSFIGLAIGNFLFMYFDNSGNLNIAIERTFFQFVALFLVFISTYFKE